MDRLVVMCKRFENGLLAMGQGARASILNGDGPEGPLPGPLAQALASVGQLPAQAEAHAIPGPLSKAEAMKLECGLAQSLLMFESVLIASLSSEAEWSSAHMKFWRKALRDGLREGAPLLSNLRLDINPKYKYMLAAADRCEVEEVKTETSPAKPKANGNKPAEGKSGIVQVFTGSTGPCIDSLVDSSNKPKPQLNMSRLMQMER